MNACLSAAARAAGLVAGFALALLITDRIVAGLVAASMGALP